MRKLLLLFTLIPCLAFGQLTDKRDGKTYKTVKIGNQVWMAENLAFRPSSGNYWAYDDSDWYLEKYGYLYEWKAAQNVCPAGWHLPSDEEWTTLTDYLGGEGVAGTKMMSKIGWKKVGYVEATNESGFSGLPAGYRELGQMNLSAFSGAVGVTYWWSSTEHVYGWQTLIWARSLWWNSSALQRTRWNKYISSSVRCIKD